MGLGLAVIPAANLNLFMIKQVSFSRCSDVEHGVSYAHSYSMI